VDKRSASTYTEIVMVDALRLSTLQQLLLTLNLTAARLPFFWILFFGGAQIRLERI
jgi:hypothetical protein